MSLEHAAAPPDAGSSPAADVPLVVDLDGTLLRTDTLVESMLLLAKKQPSSLLMLPLWLARGRAWLKHQLAGQARIDASALPFASDVLDHLCAQRRAGRRLVLATGTDERIAQAVAGELGLFDAVLASDGRVNLTAGRKRDRLVAEFGERGFDYAGNGWADLPVWSAARRALLVGTSHRLAQAVRQVTVVERVFDDRSPRLATWLEAMRPHHWLKNLLLLVPLVAAHRLYDTALLLQALVGLASFSLAASGVYLFNDLLDLPVDRRHPHKRRRALASGRMPLLHALALAPCLWLAATALALALPAEFLAVLGVYAALMLTYSVGLKNIAIVDVFVLAMGYTLRIVAGSVMVGIAVSPWLLVCSAALFFGLALLKRYAELVALRAGVGHEARVRAYSTTDGALIAGLGAASGGIAVTLLALYPLDEPTGHVPWPLWVLCTLLLLWTGHMWLMAHRGNIPDDPVAFALRDRVSRGLGLATLAILLLTT